MFLGAGPGGYVAAIRAAQLGMKVAVVEQDNVGGVCLNWGCIPSKALLRNAEIVNLFKKADEFGITYDNLEIDYSKAIDRSRQVVRRLTNGVGFLFKKNNIESIQGTGVIKDKNTVVVTDSGQTLNTDKIVIATGARPRAIPNVTIDKETVITYHEAMLLKEVPPRIAIVGGGAIGVEFADVYHSYGAEVTIIEMLPRLIPLEDAEISQQLERSYKKRGIKFLTGSAVQSVTVNDGIATVAVSNDDGETIIECDKVLMAVGIQGNIDNIGIEDIGVLTERGYVVVDDYMQTNVPGVYAIGDVTGKMPLAHVASAQGVTAVEAMAGLNPPTLDYSLMPRATYCHPQIASFGLTEEQAKEQGYSIKVGKFPLLASGKALALGETDGMIKLVTEAEIGEILGAHMIGAEVTELLGELGMTKLLEGTTAELGWLVHPHPSISETIKEAALAAEEQAIHI